MKKLKILLIVLLFLGLPTFLFASCGGNEEQELQTISFICNDALVVGDMPDQIKKEEGDVVTLPNCLATKENYSFFGWYFSNNEYAPGSEFVVPSVEVTFEPIFKINQYELIVDGGLGSGTFEYGSSTQITPEVSDDKIFDYWIIDGEKVDEKTPTLTINKNITAKAYYKNLYNIKISYGYIYSVDEDIINPTVSEKKIAENSKVVIKANEPQENMQFIGWAETETGGSIISSENPLNITANKAYVLYARYEEIVDVALSQSIYQSIYYKGETATFNSGDLKLIITQGGKSETLSVLDPSIIIEGFSTETVGEHKVFIKYTDKNDKLHSFALDYKVKEKCEISVNEYGYIVKVEYESTQLFPNSGENSDVSIKNITVPEGSVVTVGLVNGSYKSDEFFIGWKVYKDEEPSEFNSTETIFKFTASSNLNINGFVEQIQITKISVDSSKDYQNEYWQNYHTNFNLENLCILVEYNNKTTKFVNVTNSMISGFSAEVEGLKSLTINYTENVITKTCELQYNVLKTYILRCVNSYINKLEIGNVYLNSLTILYDEKIEYTNLVKTYNLPVGASLEILSNKKDTLFFKFSQWSKNAMQFEDPETNTTLNYTTVEKNIEIAPMFTQKSFENVEVVGINTEYAIGSEFSMQVGAFIAVDIEESNSRKILTYNSINFKVENFDTSFVGNKKAKLCYIDNEFSVELLEFEYSVYNFYNVSLINAYIYSINDVVQDSKITSESFKSGTQLVFKPINRDSEFLTFASWNNGLLSDEYIIESLEEDIVVSALYSEFEIESIELVDGDEDPAIAYKVEYEQYEVLDVSNMFLKINYVNGGEKTLAVLQGDIEYFTTLIIGECSANVVYKSHKVKYNYTVTTNLPTYKVEVNNGLIVEVDNNVINMEISERDFVEGVLLKIQPLVGENQYFIGWFNQNDELVSSELDLIITTTNQHYYVSAKIENDGIIKVTPIYGFKNEFNHNEELALNLMIEVEYASGKTVSNIEVENEMIDSELNFSTDVPGNKQAKITYIDEYGNEGILLFDYKVNKFFKSFEASISKTDYYLNESAESIFANILFEVTYSDDSVELINNDLLTISELDTSTEGEKEITVSYECLGNKCESIFTILVEKAPEIAIVKDLDFNIEDDLINVTWKNDDSKTAGFNVIINGTKINSEIINVNDNLDYVYSFEYEISGNINEIIIESVPKEEFGVNYSNASSKIEFASNYELINIINNFKNIESYNVVITNHENLLQYQYSQNAEITYEQRYNLENSNIEYEFANIEENGFVFHYENNEGTKESYITSKTKNNLYNVLESTILSKIFEIDYGINLKEYKYFICSDIRNVKIFTILIENETSKILAKFKVLNDDSIEIYFREKKYVSEEWIDVLSFSFSNEIVTPEIDYESNFIYYEVAVDENVESVVGNYSGIVEGNHFVKGESVEIKAKDIIDNKAFYLWSIQEGGNEIGYVLFVNPFTHLVVGDIEFATSYSNYINIVNQTDYLELNNVVEIDENKFRAFNSFDIKYNMHANQLLNDSSRLVFEFAEGASYKMEIVVDEEFGAFTVIDVDTLLTTNQDFIELVETYGNELKIYIENIIPRYNITFDKGIDDAIKGYEPEFNEGYYTVGDIIVLPDNLYVKDRYEFKGWSDGENVYQPGDEYLIVKDVEFTPIFEQKHFTNEITISFINSLTGETVYQYINAGEQVLPDNRITDENKYFGYWKKQGEDQPFDFSNAILESTVFESVWYNKNNLTLEVNKADGYALITDGRNALGETVNVGGVDYLICYLPEYYMGYKVLVIDDFAFSDYNSNVQIFVNNSIEIIGKAAFGKTSNSLNLKIVGFVGEINNDEFIYNTSIKYIDDYAFANLFYFEKFSVGELSDLNYIGEGAFKNTLLEDVCIGKNVEYIGVRAFEGAYIKNLTFESGGEAELVIDDYAFYDSMRNWGNAGSDIYSATRINNRTDYAGNSKNPKTIEDSYVVELPNRLISVGLFAFMQFAFDGCGSGIKSIKVNSSIDSILDGAFAIVGLENIIIYNFATDINVDVTDNGKYAIEDGILYELDLEANRIAILTVVSGYNHEFANNEFVIEQSITKVGAFAFMGILSENLSKIIIPETVIEIGKGAFVLDDNKVNLLILEFKGEIPNISNTDKVVFSTKNYFMFNEKANVVLVINYDYVATSLSKIDKNQEKIISKLIIVSEKTAENLLVEYEFNETLYNLLAYSDLNNAILDVNNENALVDLVDGNIYYCKMVLKGTE